ncbi:unnamed protein product [Blepharisma stoltei]|uniref:Bromo domain-containing protein n=1 Tax=Blepharisma stoltei TaxID=1481888 RepID=A0AAU9IJ28_9CILI|nr:unnamed protein product [Blepharisma stoltei]
MSSSDSYLSNPEIFIMPLHLKKINKLMPVGYKLDPDILKPSHSGSQKKIKSKHHKDSQAVKKNKNKEDASSEWTDKYPGLKTGGAAAQRCYEILQNMKKQNLCSSFLQPVDPVALNLPDYLEVIHDPIDLSAVERNLKAGVYENSQQFAVDIRRIWLNSFTYNSCNSDMFYITLEMATYFEKQFKDAEDLLFVPGDEIRKMNRDKSIIRNYMDRPMTLNEKKILAANLRRLDKDDTLRAQQIISKGKTNTPIAQFNIAKLSTRTLRELEKLVKLSYQAEIHSNRHLKYPRKQAHLDSEDLEAPEKRVKRVHYNNEMEY